MLKHTIAGCQSKGASIAVVSRNKDILGDLLDVSGLEYINLVDRRVHHGWLDVVKELAKREARLFSFAKQFKPDIMIGTSAEITHAGALLRRPSIVLNEDDIDVVPHFARSAYPLASTILSPTVCRVGKYEYKRCGYAGYQKLAYLHPNRFEPDPKIGSSLRANEERYALIRWVSLDAHHDAGIKGLTIADIDYLIPVLSDQMKVYISAEKALPPHLESYRLPSPISAIHSVMNYADLVIADSQSMSVEAAVLGVPNIRYSGFVGRISVLEELESAFGLTRGIRGGDRDMLIGAVRELSDPGVAEQWRLRRKAMLQRKIDVTALLVWMIEHYPRSIAELKSDPVLQFKVTGHREWSRRA